MWIYIFRNKVFMNRNKIKIIVLRIHHFRNSFAAYKAKKPEISLRLSRPLARFV